MEHEVVRIKLLYLTVMRHVIFMVFTRIPVFQKKLSELQGRGRDGRKVQMVVNYLFNIVGATVNFICGESFPQVCPQPLELY